MKLLRIFAALTALLLIFAACAADQSPDQIWADVQARGAILLDVREPHEFATGHVPGAINMPVGNVRFDIVTIAPDFDQEILLICRTGNRTQNAAATLRAIGYTNVLDIGGVLDWPGELIIP